MSESEAQATKPEPAAVQPPAARAAKEEALHGLTCPQCGGVVPVPEGQVIVRCPYCDLRSLVRGERGIRRYQVPQQVPRQDVGTALEKFLKSNWAIAMDARQRAKLHEAFLVYLPFWTVWGRVAAWAFGEKQVGSGDDKRYEPREVRIVEEMTWNGAACDVGEFGVNQAPLADQPMQPFNPDALHAAGMVFEPAGSFAEARQTAEDQFQAQVKRKAKLDRLSQLFVRYFRRRYGLVYYPLWVLRYLYRGRAFQVVVDGYSGKVLYGKAPGNTFYRAAVLVGGMALGALLAIDIPGFLMMHTSSDSDSPLGLAIVLFVFGIAAMYGAYRVFRYGEQYEYRPGGPSLIRELADPAKMISNEFGVVRMKEVETWISRLS